MLKCCTNQIGKFHKSILNVNLQCLFQISAQNKFLHSLDQSLIRFQPEVEEALDLGKPVVALESTIITHGMPYPSNFRTATEVQNVVRDNAAIPATVGIIDGKIQVGMCDEMLNYLAESSNTHKLSRRDIGAAIANKLSGGTTVSATMLIAHWCGIKVFVTGGIGGVHKMGESTMDVSTDLKELGRTPVMVVSAGIKSILDIGRTLEYLETEGVMVSTFGETMDFPSFFTPTSGFRSPYSIESVEKAAKLLKTYSELDLQSGILLAVPIPNTFSDLSHTIDAAINKAFEETKNLKVSGKDVTPYMLQRVNELTDGLSLKANVLLIKNNAGVGAQVAKFYSDLMQVSKKTRYFERNEPVIIGGCNADVISKCIDSLETGGASNPATVNQSHGGVGRNITEVLWRLNSKPSLISAVGSDLVGDGILQHLKSLDLSGIARISDVSTGLYNVILGSDGEMFVGVCDSRVHDFITPDHVMKHEERIKKASLVCVDGNIPESTMSYTCSLCAKHNIPVLYEPTEVLTAGSSYLARSPHQHSITYMTPSVAELVVIYEAVTGEPPPAGFEGIPDKDEADFLKILTVMCKELQQFTPNILITLGKSGVFSATLEGGTNVFTHYGLSPRPTWSWLDKPIANVMGAGDSFAAGFIVGLLRHNDVDVAVRIGITVAQRTLRTHGTVSTDISELDLNVEPSDWRGVKMTGVF